MSITFGFVPERLGVLLPPDAAFVLILRNKEGDWPVGSAVELVFSPADDFEAAATWPADIDGDLAMWERTAADCRAVLALNGPITARLFYTEPDGTRLLWGRGQARAA